jgi:hypothetical protein
VGLVRTDVSEERITAIIWVKRIGEIETLVVTSNSSMLQRNILTRTTRLHIPEGDFFSLLASFAVLVIRKGGCTQSASVTLLTTVEFVPTSDDHEHPSTFIMLSGRTLKEWRLGTSSNNIPLQNFRKMNPIIMKSAHVRLV